jgi:TolB-like protein
MLRSLKLFIILFLSLFFFIGCIGTQEVVVSKPFPYINDPAHHKVRISVFSFDNYTDTPQAGQRAANLMEGMLSARGYSIVNNVDTASRTLQAKRALAQGQNSRYILIGGVTEWRYKTGIDGEPAISLQVKLIDSTTGSVVWSAAGSDNNWGNASIGTTAQGLFKKILF